MREHAVDALAYGVAAYAEMNRRALTARPVQGSHRFMRTHDAREIPATDDHAGYRVAVQRAIESLDEALKSAIASGLDVSPYIARIRELAES